MQLIRGYKHTVLAPGLGDPPTFWGIRTPRYKYVETYDVMAGPEIELYDLVADPYELESVADDPRYATVRSNLASRLQALRTRLPR